MPKSYRVRMTEGVAMTVRFTDPLEDDDLGRTVEIAMDRNLLVHVRESGPGSELLSINPRHVLYVREVAE